MTRIGSGVAIHGGVGVLSRKRLTPELQAAYRAALAEALEAGEAALAARGSALDAACAAVRIMEDSELFNAGRGSNLDERGVVTMDASIMDGPTGSAGAVAGVTGVRHPIDLARRIMEDSEHVLLIGEGAEAFARVHGLEFQPPEFFLTERRVRAMERARGKRDALPDVIGEPDLADRSGTVGAVALDRDGRLAAATSTGGMAAKAWGRVGDSPLIGAGTWASDHCAISSTGWGEYFIRNATAHEVHMRMALAGQSLEEASHAAIFETLEADVSGAGGLVALDGDGRIAFPFSTPGMYRGWIGAGGKPHLAIFGDEEETPPD